MPDPTQPQQPQLGYGKPSEATIDQVNKWMRSTPWYQQLLKSWGQDPNNVHLNDAQKTQIVRAAQAQGVVVDEGKMEVDPSGNFNPKGHKLRNTLIVAGVAGATIATMGAAGVFSGAASTVPAATTGATSGLTGVEAGALSGLGTTALPGAGTALTGGALSGLGSTALPGAGTLLSGSGVAGGLPGAGTALPLASTDIGSGMMGPIAGGAGSTGLTGGGAMSNLSPYIKNLLSQKGSEALGKSLAGGADAMAHNRGTMAELMLTQNGDLEKQLIAREDEKRRAQSDAYSNMMMGQHAVNWNPTTNPFSSDVVHTSQYQGSSPESKAAGQQLYDQALKRLSLPDLQNPTGMAPYNNLLNDPNFKGSLKPGILERSTGIASWALPLASQILGWGK